MSRHHYVPQYLLDKWAISGELSAFSWHATTAKVLQQKVAVRAACQLQNLNALAGERGDHAIEARLTDEVDTPSAVAHRIILTQGVKALSGREREAWAKLIVSLPVRTPEVLNGMGVMHVAAVHTVMRGVAAERPNDIALIEAWREEHEATRRRNWPRQSMSELAVKPEHVEKVAKLHWLTIKFDSNGLMIGDRPLLSHPPKDFANGMSLDHPDCLLCLPIAPNEVFLAYANIEGVKLARGLGKSELLSNINAQTIRRADTHVYARAPTDAFIVWISNWIAQAHAEQSALKKPTSIRSRAGQDGSIVAV